MEGEGGGGGHFFPALRASVWSNNNGGGEGGEDYLRSATDFLSQDVPYQSHEYGRFPFVRIDRPDLFRRNDNQFPFNQNSPAKSVKS